MVYKLWTYNLHTLLKQSADQKEQRLFRHVFCWHRRCVYTEILPEQCRYATIFGSRRPIFKEVRTTFSEGHARAKFWFYTDEIWYGGVIYTQIFSEPNVRYLFGMRIIFSGAMPKIRVM